MPNPLSGPLANRKFLFLLLTIVCIVRNVYGAEELLLQDPARIAQSDSTAAPPKPNEVTIVAPGTANAISISGSTEHATVEVSGASLLEVIAALEEHFGRQITVIDLEERSSPVVNVALHEVPLVEIIKDIARLLPVAGYAIYEHETSANADTPAPISMYLFGRGDPQRSAPTVDLRSGDVLPGQDANSRAPTAYFQPASETELLWLRNHRRLRSLQNEVANYLAQVAGRRDTAVVHDVPDVRGWIQALYDDVLLMRALEAGLTATTAQSLVASLADTDDTVDFDQLSTIVPNTDDYYHNDLRQLAERVYAAPAPEIGEHEMVDIALRVRNLGTKRKRYADKLYLQEIQAYCSDRGVPVAQKLDYLSVLVADGEIAMGRYGMGVLESIAKRFPLAAEDQAALNAFKNSIVRSSD